MDSVKLMMEEHQNILRMLEVVRNACYGIYKGEDICYEDFAKMIDFIRNYADNHHHGKEENYCLIEWWNTYALWYKINYPWNDGRT